MKPISFFKPVFLAAVLFIAGTAKAQMVGTSAFLKGHYVEVGIGHLGYYGSDTAAPTGYHPHLYAGAYNLGFVADPDSTNWDTSAAAHYQGDFFYPGAPFEGWELQVNGPRCEGFNFGNASAPFRYGGGALSASGANLSYTSSGSTVTSTWQGLVDSIQVTQITTLDTNALYFTTTIILTNLATTPADNIYYFRTLDPDNDESWPGGGFTTNNLIEHQSAGGVADYSVVSASGTAADHQYLALGSGDTASRAVIYTSWPIDTTVDISTIYGETYSTGMFGSAWYNAGAAHPGDIAIGLVINVPHLATVDSAADSVYRTTSLGALHPANSASFKYFYAFGPAAVPDAVNATRQDTAITTGGSTLAIKNANKASDVKVYPNPAGNTINVTGLNITDNLTLYDMMGRETGQTLTAGTTGTNTFSLTDIPAGNYIMVVQDANGNMKARIPLRKH